MAATDTPARGLLALTLRQPWAWAILHGKPVENRSWPVPFGEMDEIAIHAGARSGWDKDGQRSRLVQEAWCRYATSLPPMNAAGPLRRESLFIDFSAIVAVAEDVTSHHADDCNHICPEPEDWDGNVLPCIEYGGACVNYCSAWAAEGQYHWSWKTLRMLASPVPCRGWQKLWAVDAEAERAVRAQQGATDDAG